MLLMPALLAALALPQAARPAPPPPPPPPPQDLTLPPETASIVTILEGRGVQIYVCQSTPAGPRWTFTAPDAQLFNLATGKPVGQHGAGPLWTLEDGSAIHGTVLHSRPGATPADVPWLLLQTTPAPNAPLGTLNAVKFVRRYNTHGGAPPSPEGCDAGHLGQQFRVPYSANYAFYSAPGAASLLQTGPLPNTAAPAPAAAAPQP